MSAAVAEPDVDVETQPPKRPPLYVVVIHNDNDHTFAYVIELLQKVFGYSLERCVELAKEVHDTERAAVWMGQKEIAELKLEQLQSGGPDVYATSSVTYPIGCHIEPIR